MPALTIDLALQGGGSKGIALNAAIAELRRRGHRVRRVVGTSAGAIAGALLAAGFTDEELLEMSLGRTDDDLPLFAEYVSEPIVPAVSDAPLSELQLAALRLPGPIGKSLLLARAASDFFERGGFVSGNGFADWLARTLEGKSPGLSRVTLRELHQKTGRHLTIIVTDTTARRLRALNHLTAPDCPLVWAVRMSMSIPLIFAEVVWRAEWGAYVGEDLTGNVMVDGGVLTNLPLAFILPTATPLVGRLMGPATDEAIAVGLALDATREVPGAPEREDRFGLAARLADTRMGQRIAALTDTMLNAFDHTLSDTAKGHLCHLPVKGYSATEFEMSLARAEALMAAATAAAAAYFDELEGRETREG